MKRGHTLILWLFAIAMQRELKFEDILANIEDEYRPIE